MIRFYSKERSVQTEKGVKSTSWRPPPSWSWEDRLLVDKEPLGSRHKVSVTSVCPAVMSRLSPGSEDTGDFESIKSEVGRKVSKMNDGLEIVLGLVRVCVSVLTCLKYHIRELFPFSSLR